MTVGVARVQWDLPAPLSRHKLPIIDTSRMYNYGRVPEQSVITTRADGMEIRLTKRSMGMGLPPPAG